VRLSPEQVLYTLNHARPDLLIVHADFLPLLETIRDRLESVRTFILILEGGALASRAIMFESEYEELLGSGSDGHVFPDFDENTCATTFYTTGTTGNPKGVAFSHRQIVLHALAVAAAIGTGSQQCFHRDDVYMPITPMFHVHAWGFPYVATMLGVKQVYPGRYSPELLLGLLQRERVTFSHCVPTILHMLLDLPAGAGVDFSRWRVIIGGSALSGGLAKAAVARGIDVFTGYGMSETCPVLTLSHLDADMALTPERELEIRMRAGRPIPLVDLRIVDEELRDVPHDGHSVGEVVARAPWLTHGYRGDPDASGRLWAGGVLHTGDIGVIDGDGYLQITDRIKDVIKTGGEWISSLALEDIISRHESVGECAVVGVVDAKWGERPVAFVVPRAGSSLDAAQVCAHVKGCADRGLISRYGVPERVLIVESLERTSVGKLDKKAMRARLRATA
jgi:fatty-acyl-CoA synthase